MASIFDMLSGVLSAAWRLAFVLFSLYKSVTALLVVHREERYIGDRSAIKTMSSGLKKALQTLIVLIQPRHGEEVGVVYSPIGWSGCRSIVWLWNS